MSGIDLNLLRIFDALMELRSVTRVADDLGITQSAVSHSLARLRKALDDPLFLRSPSGLQPTTRAEEIASGVREGLVRLQTALSHTHFDPSKVERHFTIAAGSYFCTLLIPTLVEQVRREAPGVSLRIVPASDQFAALLDRGTVNLALGASTEVRERLVMEPLYEERMVWIASSENPIVGKRLDAGQLAALPRVAIAPSQPFEALQSGGGPYAPEGQDAPLARESITVYDSQTAVAIVARTDLVALVARKMAARAVAREGIVMLDHVVDASSFGLAMIWHARHRSDAGLAWLRDKIRDAAL